VPVVVLIAALPLIQRDALRRGKARAYKTAMWVGILGFPLIGLVDLVPGVPTLPLALASMVPVGFAAASVAVFPIALMDDIIDHDARQTGLRREGTYYASLYLVDALVVALHALVLAGLLQLGGTADNPLGVRLVGLVAGLGALTSWFVFRRYHLPAQVDPAPVPDAIPATAAPPMLS
jgi:GPH family glycoside/pentoside/hexuronide:cation symporter